MVEDTRPPDGQAEVHHPDGRIEHPAVRYEHSDANFRWILRIVLGAVVFAAVVHFVIWQFFRDYGRYQDEVKQSPYPLAPAPSTALPPEPRLEQLDRTAGIERPDVYKRELSREEILDSYGATEEKGYMHIPIERAMAYLVDKNKLPARAAPPAGVQSRDDGLVDAGASNSGRMFRKRPR
jgi:hypothetical protein